MTIHNVQEIQMAKLMGWKWTPIELVDGGQAFGYESPDKKRFLTAQELIDEMRESVPRRREQL